MHNFVYYSYQISFLLCFSIYKKNKTQSPFPLQISHIWWNGIYVTLKSRTLWAPPYFNLLQSPSSLRLKVVFCSPSSTFPCKMNGTDAVGQDSTPWTPSPHYLLSMRSTNLFFDRCFSPNLSLLWGLIDIEKEGRWADQEPPNQREDDIGATSHVSGLWKNKLLNYFPRARSWQNRTYYGCGPPKWRFWCFLREWMVHRTTLEINSHSKYWLKMQVRAWILWVSCFCTLAELSHRCGCYDLSPTDTRVSKGSKSRVKEHVRHGHHHTPHRIKPPRRKGETTSSKDLPEVSLTNTQPLVAVTMSAHRLLRKQWHT